MIPQCFDFSRLDVCRHVDVCVSCGGCGMGMCTHTHALSPVYPHSPLFSGYLKLQITLLDITPKVHCGLFLSSTCSSCLVMSLNLFSMSNTY